MMFFHALLFDLNGTLVDIYRVSEYRQHLDAMADVLGLKHDKFRDAWSRSFTAWPHGDYPSLQVRFELALGYCLDTSEYPSREAIAEAIRIRVDYITTQQGKVKEGVPEALDWAVGQGYKLGLISNCSLETSEYWETIALSRWFPEPTLSCIVKLNKPDAAIFLYATERLGVEPERCIYIADGDDHEFDTATALGMEVLLVRYDTTDTYRNEPIQPETRYAIDHFNEFQATIERIEADHDGN
jgi:putative hydrolase of the HAD superfamily